VEPVCLNSRTTTAISRKMNLTRIKALAGAAGGWMNDAEGFLLYQLARKCSGRGAIVEIGS